jgi:hypothetical protein
MTRNRIRTIALVAATVVLVIGSYIAFQKHTARGQVTALVQDSSTRLRAALKALGANEVVDVDAHAKAAEANARKLRELDTSALTPFADAADDYLISAREILRRHADIVRARADLSANLDALATHMKSDRGAAAWPQDAVRLKAPLDRNLRDYTIAVQSYASLLGSLGASQRKIAPYVDNALLIDETLVDSARQRVLDAHANAEGAVKQAVSLETYRRAR